MLDLLIKNGTVIDGTGTPRQRADVAINDGRVVEIGRITDAAQQVIDAEGRVVAPGFVDIHTHYDAQVFWDPMLTPSCLHGVTTVLGGNCGFTIAPIDPETAPDVRALLSRVEAIPTDALEAGADWSWQSFGEYLDRIDGNLGVNAGFSVGHSPIRRLVMGERAHEKATPDDIARMAEILDASIAAGGLGFSSSWGTAHTTAPTLAASDDELIALAAVAGRYPGTVLEFIPSFGAAPDREARIEMMAAMSRAADRPLNWNALTFSAADQPGHAEGYLAASDYAAAHGGAVFALTTPVPINLRINFQTGFLFDVNPYWKKTLFDRSIPERIAVLRDPDHRRALVEAISGESRRFYQLSNLSIAEVQNPALSRFVGRKVGEIAAQTGAEPSDALFDLLLEDDLRTVLKSDQEDDDATWARRAETWNDPRVIVGASDAGAHLDMMTTYGLYSTFAGDLVRAGLDSLEKSIHLITDRPARLFGITRRGRLAPGWWADVVVFDPKTLSNEPPETVADLPGGASRLVSGATGVDHVIVNGSEILCEGKPTGSLPGRLLRSGIDTETVTVADAHRLSPIP